MPKKMLCLLLSACMSGCATYSYDGATYHSAEEALAAQKAAQADILAHITVLPQTQPGTVLVVLPSKSTIDATVVTRKGTPDQKFINYLDDVLSNDFGQFPEYLAASKAFAKVESKVTDYPLRDAQNSADQYTATVYLYFISPSQGGWFLITPKSQKAIPIIPDSLAKGSAKVNSWIEHVVDAASHAGKQ